MVTGVDVPTALTNAEAEALRILARDLDVLEFGSQFGASTIVLAKVARHVDAVDWHKGDAFAGIQDTFDFYKANLRRYHVADKVTTYVCTFEEFGRLYRTPASILCEFGFLDGFHTAEAVERDIGLMTGHLSTDSVLACHDYGRFGVSEGIGRASKEYGWEIVGVVESLAILGRPHIQGVAMLPGGIGHSVNSDTGPLPCPVSLCRWTDDRQG